MVYCDCCFDVVDVGVSQVRGEVMRYGLKWIMGLWSVGKMGVEVVVKKRGRQG
jgi:hypothetical protein